MKRLMKVVASTLCAGLVLSSGLFATSPIVEAATDVVINETNFPDASFRDYVSTKCDTNGDKVLSQSEIDNVTDIEITNTNATTLKGIEYFTSLTTLSCYSNKLTSLDVNKNTILKTLSCYGNQLTSLDVSNATSLSNLSCYNNQLTSLDVSNNTALSSLICSGNQLTNLDVSNNTALSSLSCNSNQLTSLDVSNNTALEFLLCYDNKLTSLDVSNSIALTSMVCFANQLTSLDVSENTALSSLICNGNQLTSLDVRNNTALIFLYCGSNQLTSLDVSKNKALATLNCEKNQLTSLDVSKNPLLTDLSCYNNQLTSLDISNNLLIKKLYCFGNYIANLDISSNSDLIKLCDPQNMVKPCPLNIADTDDEDIVTWVSYSIGLSGKYIDKYMVIAPYTELTANDEKLYIPEVTVPPIPTNTPTPTKESTPTSTVAPTSTPTAVPSTPAPTVVPTTAPELNVGDFVNRCYMVALCRDADTEGYKYWVNNLNNGAVCGAQVGYGFIFSSEYIGKNRSNEDFVKDLYSMYFDREPDVDGYHYWMNMLEDGVSRETVFAGFANSLEFYNLCTKYGVTQGYYLVGVDNTQQGGINCFVARLYQVCFNRLPDMAGQNGWVDKLYKGEVTGTSCAYGFVFSPEFIGQKPSNEEFVNYMYAAFFGREADSAGFNAWVSVLNDGGSYEDVFNGFTGSIEFYNLCAEYGISA
ncbi:MAG: DUF4214 domain-containing protein [Clostridia bacterium]|nr:DUF4214 domain-containing protein [Clostridia bacterium]